MPEQEYEFDYRQVRALLAAHRIAHKDFAARCRLSVQHISRVLCGYPVGELTRIKIARGLQLLGLDKELPRAS